MTDHNSALWHHEHHFGMDIKQTAERQTYWVIGLTLITMLIELITGYKTGSMALTADGWHMGTHAAALSLAAFAYYFARRNANNPRFTFGSGKTGPLGGFASAISLGIVSLLMAIESIQRLLAPVPVEFTTALTVAIVGLIVNLLSAWLLGAAHHGHDHGQGDDEHHDHHDHHDHHEEHAQHQDHNLKGAYLHVIADALTSVTAIIALICGMTLGWVWMDPMMGIIGSIVIGVWAYGLIKESAKTLLDAEDNFPLRTKISKRLLVHKDCEIADLHLWRVGPTSHACIISLIAHQPDDANHYKALLHGIAGLDHITIEINHCQSCPV